MQFQFKVDNWTKITSVASIYHLFVQAVFVCVSEFIIFTWHSIWFFVVALETEGFVVYSSTHVWDNNNRKKIKTKRKRSSFPEEGIAINYKRTKHYRNATMLMWNEFNVIPNSKCLFKSWIFRRYEKQFLGREKNISKLETT